MKRGILKKRNEFFMKQGRMFILTNEPSLKYYKNETELRVRKFCSLFREKFLLTGRFMPDEVGETGLKL